ncbi:MAG: protein kinase [Chloracidobacterium sp.]|nr:protein kinase [Chloracidobacterium sp.]MDW8217342.1 protein kinase [Acidobacteriota bacterium]
MTVLRLENVELDGRYRVERHLATGVETAIFLALDNVAGRPVVVKAFIAHLRSLSPAAEPSHPRLEAFRREGLWLDRVSHPNIVQRLASGRAYDLTGVAFDYHVLEYLAGGSLAALSRSAGGLPPDMALRLLRQAAAALSHCHALSVVHGDVEPTNLLLTSDHQTLKLADFGAAADDETPRRGDQADANRLRIYAPPECRAVAPMSAATDVYGLAKTLYAVLAGEPPTAYVGEPIGALPPRLSAWPTAEALLGVLRQATATLVTARYPSVAAFWSEVERVLTPPATVETTLTLVPTPAGPALEATNGVSDQQRKRQDKEDDAPVAKATAEMVSDSSPTVPPTITRLIGVGVCLAALVLFIGGLTALYRLARASVREYVQRRTPPTAPARPLFKVKVVTPTKVYAAPTDNPTPRDWLGDLAAGVEADVLEMKGDFYRIRPQKWARRKAALVTEGWVLREQVDGGF